jgi:hypothetical protein
MIPIPIFKADLAPDPGGLRVSRAFQTTSPQLGGGNKSNRG